MTDNLIFVNPTGAGLPFDVIVVAVRASQPGDDVTITVTAVAVEGSEPTLRPDPAPGGGGSWWIWG